MLGWKQNATHRANSSFTMAINENAATPRCSRNGSHSLFGHKTLPEANAMHAWSTSLGLCSFLLWVTLLCHGDVAATQTLSLSPSLQGRWWLCRSLLYCFASWFPASSAVTALEWRKSSFPLSIAGAWWRRPCSCCWSQILVTNHYINVGILICLSLSFHKVFCGDSGTCSLRERAHVASLW